MAAWGAYRRQSSPPRHCHRCHVPLLTLSTPAATAATSSRILGSRLATAAVVAAAQRKWRFPPTAATPKGRPERSDRETLAKGITPTGRAEEGNYTLQRNHRSRGHTQRQRATHPTSCRGGAPTLRRGAPRHWTASARVTVRTGALPPPPPPRDDVSERRAASVNHATTRVPFPEHHCYHAGAPATTAGWQGSRGHHNWHDSSIHVHPISAMSFFLFVLQRCFPPSTLFLPRGDWRGPGTPADTIYTFGEPSAIVRMEL